IGILARSNFFASRDDVASAVIGSYDLPEGMTFGFPTTAAGKFALSPDGRRLAFVGAEAGGDRRRIWVRRLESMNADAIPGTEGAGSVIWSADSRFIGFEANGRL